MEPSNHGDQTCLRRPTLDPIQKDQEKTGTDSGSGGIQDRKSVESRARWDKSQHTRGENAPPQEEGLRSARRTPHLVGRDAITNDHEYLGKDVWHKAAISQTPNHHDPHESDQAGACQTSLLEARERQLVTTSNVHRQRSEKHNERTHHCRCVCCVGHQVSFLGGPVRDKRQRQSGGEDDPARESWSDLLWITNRHIHLPHRTNDHENRRGHGKDLLKSHVTPLSVELKLGMSFP